MPYRSDAHVLTVDANVIHKVNMGNSADLSNMWKVFSQCADSVEQGRRLENLIWRLWQRETFQSASNSISPPILPQNIPSEVCRPDFPRLSGSVESLTDEKADDFAPVPTRLDTCCPRTRIQGSCTSGGSKQERHLNSDDIEKMIVSIVNDNGLLSAPPHISPVVAPLKESLPMPPACERSGSTAESSPVSKSIQSKKFTLGSASFSSTEQDQSLGNHKPTIPIVKKSMFHIGVSSEEDGSLKSALASSQSSYLFSPQKKQASFSTNVMTCTIEDEAAVGSDTDYIDESAIDDDDDDSSDWEDSIEDSDKSSMDDKFFQRVDSKPNLTSRRSLITLMLAKNERARNLGNHASQSTSAITQSRMALNGPSLGAPPSDLGEAPVAMKSMRSPTLEPIKEIPQTNARPIAATGITHSRHPQGKAAWSPHTTRRNMITTELTESLRRHLLWERQQKSSTANAVLKRRHTSHDMANLRQYPEKPCIKTSEDVNARRHNEVFSKEASHDRYHSKGW